MTDLWSGRFKAAVLAVLPLALMVLGTKIFMSDVPLAIYLQGVVEGLMLALIALGFVIVYRANRIVNFSAADLGNAPATFAFLLFGSLGWNIYLSMFIGLASAVVLGVLVEFIFLRRFFTAPRLIMTVATIGVTQLLVALALLLPQWLGSSDVTTYQAIINVNFSVGVVPFGGADVMVLLVVPIVFRAARRVLPLQRGRRRVARQLPRTPTAPPCSASRCAGCNPSCGASPRPSRSSRCSCASGSRPEHRRRPRSRDSARRPRRRRDRSHRTHAHGGARRSRPRHRPTSGDVPLPLERLHAGVDRPGDRDRAPRPTRRHGRAPREFGHLDVAARRARSGGCRPNCGTCDAVRMAYLAAGAILVVFLALVPLLFAEDKIKLAGTIGIYAIIGLSLVVLTGWAGQVSLGQMGFVGFSGAIAGTLAVRWHWDTALILVVSGLVGAITTIIVGLPTLRARGLAFAVMTLAFSLANTYYFLNTGYSPIKSWVPTDAVPRTHVFGVISIDTETRFYVFVLIVLALCIFMMRSLRASRIGRVLIGVRDNEKVAQAYSIERRAAHSSSRSRHRDSSPVSRGRCSSSSSARSTRRTSTRTKACASSPWSWSAAWVRSAARFSARST